MGKGICVSAEGTGHAEGTSALSPSSLSARGALVPPKPLSVSGSCVVSRTRVLSPSSFNLFLHHKSITVKLGCCI